MRRRRITQRRARRADARIVAFQSEAAQRLRPEMARQKIMRRGDVKHRRLDRTLRQLEIERTLLGVDRLARREARDVVAESRIGHRRIRRHEKVAGRHIEIRRADRITARHDRQQVTALAIDDVALRRGTRRNDAYDLAPHESLRRRRFFDLIADRDAQSMFDQLRDVTVSGVIRHAAHRRFVILTFVARGQDEVEQRRGFFRVLEEHLVEVAEAVEEDGVGDLPLDLEILLEHRRELGTGHSAGEFIVMVSESAAAPRLRREARPRSHRAAPCGAGDRRARPIDRPTARHAPRRIRERRATPESPPRARRHRSRECVRAGATDLRCRAAQRTKSRKAQSTRCRSRGTAGVSEARSYNTGRWNGWHFSR